MSIMKIYNFLLYFRWEAKQCEEIVTVNLKQDQIRKHQPIVKVWFITNIVNRSVVVKSLLS